MRNASLEDCQLLAESEILQGDLFVAAKDQKDHPKKREDCVQHEAGSVSASSLKINRLRDRWDLARDKPPVLDNAEVAVNFPVFLALCASQKHSYGTMPEIHRGGKEGRSSPQASLPSVCCSGWIYTA